MDMNRAAKYIFSVVLLLIPAACFAGQFEFSGYAKSFVHYQHSNIASSDSWTLTNPWALKLSYVPREYLSFNLTYVISPHWNSPAVLFDEPGLSVAGQNRFKDLDARIWPEASDDPKKLSLWHNLDRAYVRISANWVDLYLGRQPIAWGSARFANPTDIVAPYGFRELDTEDRIGVDAARVNIPLGQMSEIGLGFIAGKDFDMENSTLYLRPKFYLMKTDLALVLMEFKKNRLYGIDISRSLGGAGVWMEAGYIDFEETSENALRLSVGADYKLSDKTYAFGEYHFNGFGELNASDYTKNYLKQAYSEKAVYLMAQNYLTLGFNYQLTPLINSGTQPIVNLDDISVVLNQQFEYNLTQNSYLSYGFFKGLGKGTDKTLTGLIQIGSEFGSYPDIYYLSYRKYF